MTRSTPRPAARRRAVACCAVLAGLVLSGCGAGTPVRSGAAAVVGDTRITSEQLFEVVESGLSDPAAAQQLGGDRPAFQRDVLERLINAEVVEAAARRNGVSVTAGQVQEQYDAIEEQVGGPQELRTQAAAAGLSLDRVRDLARVQALSLALGDRLTQDIEVPAEQLRQAYEQGIDQFDQVRVAQILLPTLAEAQALLPQAAGRSDAEFVELARTATTDESTRERGGDLGLAPRSAYAQSELASIGEQAFAAQPGATFVAQTPRGGHVVRVLERRTVSRQDAEPELRRALLEEQRGVALQQGLRDTAADLDVSVNPRFGRWDGEALRVVARGEEPGRVLSSPSPAPGDPLDPGLEDPGEDPSDPS